MKMHAALKRGLALVLTLAMMVSIVYQGGYMHAHAENDASSVTVGQLFVENYDELTEAEKALYGSDLLAGVSYSYKAPEDAALVSVNTESKTITAGDYTDSEGNQWAIDRAEIVVGDAVKESVEFTGNTANYTYDGNAFSVRVYYALTLTGVSGQIAGQIDAAVALKEGLAAGQTVVDQEGNLYTLEVAMPELVELANTGVDLEVNGMTVPGVTMNEEAKAAVAALNGQMTANAGVLDLSVIRSAYAAAPSKVNYILTQGVGMLTCVEETQAYIASIDADLQTIVDHVDSFVTVGMVDQATADRIALLSSKVSALNAALQSVMAANWVAAEQGAALVKAGITANEYIELDSLLNAVESFSTVMIEDTLFVAESYIQYNLSMFNVDVTVVLNAATGPAGDATLYEVGRYIADTATLSEGASADEISDVIAAAVTNAQSTWASKYLTGNYVQKADVDVPGALVEDLAYTIVFEPVDCNVTLSYGGGSVSELLPYGYQMPLPTYYDVEGETDKVYDYTVNGAWMPEGSVITIEGATTISREAGEPYAALSLYELIAEQYCADDAVAYAILTSGALNGDVQMGIREPVLADLVSVVEGADSVTVTANTHYAGDATGLTWMPVECVVTTGGSTETISFNGGTTVTFTNMDYDRVDVSYKLDLSSICSDAEVLEILNIPARLTEEADAQTSALATLTSKMSDMEALTGAMMSALKGMIADTRLHADEAENARLKALFTAQVETIQSNCMQNDAEAAANGNVKYLYLLKQMQVYADANNGGLDYYYENADAIIRQVSLLGDSLTAMLAGENEKAALSILLNAANYGHYAEKIESMAGMLADVKAALTPAAAEIKVYSADLEKLTDALAGSANSYTTLSESLCLKGSHGVSSSKNVSLSVSFVIDGRGYTTTAIDMLKVDAVTANQINAIKAEIEAKAAAVLGNKAAYYANNYDASALDAIVGMTGSEAVAALADISFTWEPKEYTVHVDGMADQTITINSLSITLPASGSADSRYDYIIGGNTVSAGKYTFTAAQLDELFVNGTYTVGRVVVDVARENLISFVDALNAGTNNTGITFALVENMGNYSIVMKVDTADMGGLKNAAMGMVMTMANYDYIGIGGEALKFVDENGAAKFSIQSVIDAIMNSGMTGDDLVNAVKSNDMSKLQIVGSIISEYNMAQYGGKLAVSTMEIANAESSYPLYITIGSAHSMLVKAADAYANNLKNYVQFVCSGGNLNVSVTLPDKAYQAYLAALLLTEDITLADIAVADIDTKIAYEFLKDLAPALEDDTVTLDSWLNTLVKMGVIDSTNISYKNILTKAYDALCGVWGDVEFVNDDLASVAGIVPIKSFVDSMAADYSELLGMVVEYQTGLEVAGTVTLANTNTYNAIYFDNGADGLINKVGLTTISGDQVYDSHAAIVLTDDVTANLTFNGYTIVNLNGHTINGNIVCNGKTFVVDTSAVATGAINGTVSGSYYMSTEEYYTLTEDANGNITVVLDADAVVDGDWNKISVATLAMDVLADLVFNGYVNGELYVDGNMIYEVELADGVALYLGANTVENAFYTACTWFDNAHLSAFVDSIIDDLTDFDTLAAAAWENGEKELASYNLTTAPWNISATGVNNGEYVTVSVGGNDDEKKDISLTFVVAAEDTQDEIQKVLDVLAETVTINANVAGTQSAANKTLGLGWTASACVTVDLTGNPAYAKALCAVLACGSDNMKAAVESGDMDAMEAAFNAMTVAEAVDAIQNYDADTVKALSGISRAEVLAVGEYASKLVNYIINNHTGDIESTRTLGSFYKTGLTCECGLVHDGYGATRTDWSRNADKSLKGYTLDVTAEVEYVTVMIEIWPEEQEHVHTIVHVPAKAPTCFEEGNIEYWYCTECGYAWLDAELTLNTNLKAVILPVTHVNIVHVPAKAPTCFEEGNIEYWYCTECGFAWLDEYCHLNTNLKAVVLPAAHGNIIHVPAKAPTCFEEGNIEYWYCTECGYAWLDADCTLNTNLKAVILPAAHGTIIHVEAKAPTCFEEGNIEYWYCEDCGYAWLDADCTLNTNLKAVILPAAHGNIIHVPAKAATCFEEGNIEYWYCEDCGYAWLDKDCTLNTNLKAVILPAAHGTIIHVPAKAADCTEWGNIEYWYCEDCGYAWLDKDCTLNTNLQAVKLAPTGHSFVKAEGEDAYKAPTCTDDGYQKYICSVCGEPYTEILPATGHTHSTEWSKNETGHWHECGCGDAIDFAEHTYGDWHSNGDGTKTRACEICGWEDTALEEVKPSEPGKTGDEAPVFFAASMMIVAAAAAIVLVVLKKRERR